MSEILHKNVVLVLNRNWQAINTTTPAQAFCSMASDTATGLDVQGREHIVPIRWEQWLDLPVREGDFGVRTVGAVVRVPTLVVLAKYAKVPVRRPGFSLRAIRERDGHRCQYTGRLLEADEGSIDHVLPRSRGGPTSWTNCVLACKRVNGRKGDRTPAEAGLRLLRRPEAPRAVPATMLLRNLHGIEDWDVFLG